MWAALRRSVGGLWHATRHEPTFSSGVSDVSWGSRGIQGWVENKVLEKWPKRAETIVSVDLFTQKQKVWIWSRGPGCWFLLRVGNDWLLFDYIRCQKVGTLTKSEMFRTANATWNMTPPGKQFIQVLTEPTFYIRSLTDTQRRQLIRLWMRGLESEYCPAQILTGQEPNTPTVLHWKKSPTPKYTRS